MKRIAIMQPYLFPYLGYFQLIHAVDTFVIYDDVHYIKKGYINRNNILADRKAHQFTLELLGASQNKLINQIEIGHNTSSLLKTIEFSYKKAPFFQDISPILIDILHAPEKNLALFVGNSLQKIAQYLNLNTRFHYSSHIEKDNTLKGQDKILEICKKLGTETYINAIGGQELYDKKAFLADLIKLNFLKAELPTYPQFGKIFVPALSIIDVLMFNSKPDILRMLNQYELI